MRVVVYSMDETELDYTDDRAGVIPIRRDQSFEVFKKVWEGTMSAIPDEGEMITLADDEGSYVVSVSVRVFHLDEDTPTVALFVTSDDIEITEKC